MSWQYALGLLCIAFTTLVVLYTVRPQRRNRHDPRKRCRPNVHVPRETLWARTNKYHEGKS